MGWNYRIIEHEDRFGLHAVHYNEDGSLQSFRQEPAFVWNKDGSTEEVLEMMKAAAKPATVRVKIRALKKLKAAAIS